MAVDVAGIGPVGGHDQSSQAFDARRTIARLRLLGWAWVAWVGLGFLSLVVRGLCDAAGVTLPTAPAWSLVLFQGAFYLFLVLCGWQVWVASAMAGWDTRTRVGRTALAVFFTLFGFLYVEGLLVRDLRESARCRGGGLADERTL